MEADASPFLVLLAEDDLVSREFLTAALQGCRASVAAFADGRSALEFAQTHACSLLMLDQNLPGLTGTEILACLDWTARVHMPRAPAVALTAAADDTAPQLLAAGFVEVLAKPISGPALRAVLGRHGHAPPCVLDDDAAIAACGTDDIGRRLRRLFLEQELPAVSLELDHCAGDMHGLRPTLHRLRASCGFCGATALADAAASLQRALATGHSIADTAARFRTQLVATSAALRAKLDTE